MAAWLKITKNGQSTFIKLSSEQPINLPMQEGVQYQVVDIGGNPLEVKTLSQSKSTTLITPNGEKITLTHEHYAPIHEKSLPLNRDTVEAVEVVSSSVESSGILSTAAYIGGGLLAAGGIAAAAGSSKKSGSSPSHSEPTVSSVPTPQAELSATAPVNRPQTQQSHNLSNSNHLNNINHLNSSNHLLHYQFPMRIPCHSQTTKKLSRKSQKNRSLCLFQPLNSPKSPAMTSSMPKKPAVR